MWLFRRKGPSGFSYSSTAEDVTHGIDSSDLTAIVTGASSGIGAETTRVLALRGAHVVMAVRNVDAGNDVKEGIVKEIPSARVDVMQLDLSSMASVRKFASEFNSLNLPLNLLINNAGIMATPFMLSQDGIEMQFATNHVGLSNQMHIESRVMSPKCNVSKSGRWIQDGEGVLNAYVLGHFLLTDLLLGNMKNTARNSHIEGRIVNVSSEGHRFAYSEGIRFEKINDQAGYNQIGAYGQSKLANILHVNELTRRFEDGKLIVLYRFLVAALANTLGRLVLKNVQQKIGPSGFSYSSTVEDVTQGIDASDLTAIVTRPNQDIWYVGVQKHSTGDSGLWGCNNMLCGVASARERRDREVLQGQNLAMRSSNNVLAEEIWKLSLDLINRT
ncbi:hypothetical protein QJS04_geneDACA000388 [Acorus gramineus]|uniref:Uncharacterized protein n=1 Tax=Acorus gramineus TaxID=55184 RepID=A0AAV9ARI7_ACOGR|nr:hypothetical protein QJS04_geneDACA000388 [Acorus gramineus]